MQKKVFLPIAFVAVLILTIPLIAMQFTDQVVWTLSDFIIAGFLLFSTGTILAWATNKFPKHKIFIVALIIFAFIWLWAELAVGIFTNWGS